MKILEHGIYYNDPNKPIGFTCRVCGCKFEAEPNECHATRALDTDKSRLRNYSFRAVFRKFYTVKCPECNESVVSDIEYFI